MYEPVPADQQRLHVVGAPPLLPPGAPVPPPVPVPGVFGPGPSAPYVAPSAQFAPDRFNPHQFRLYDEPVGPGWLPAPEVGTPAGAARPPWSMRRTLAAVAVAFAIAGATAVGVAAADTGTSAQTTPGGFGNGGPGNGFRGGFGNQGGAGGVGGLGGTANGGSQVVPGAGQLPGAAAQPSAAPPTGT